MIILRYDIENPPCFSILISHSGLSPLLKDNLRTFLDLPILLILFTQPLTLSLQTMTGLLWFEEKAAPHRLGKK
jgi:hypothetical protein